VVGHVEHAIGRLGQAPLGLDGQHRLDERIARIEVGDFR